MLRNVVTRISHETFIIIIILLFTFTQDIYNYIPQKALFLWHIV